MFNFLSGVRARRWCRLLSLPATPLSLQAPKPFAAAKSLSSKTNGIAAAPRPVLAQKQQQQQQPAALALEVVCADGPRGMKLKTRKVRLSGIGGSWTLRRMRTSILARQGG